MGAKALGQTGWDILILSIKWTYKTPHSASRSDSSAPIFELEWVSISQAD